MSVPAHAWPLESLVIANPDTLLIALYVELTDRIIPSRETRRPGPGRPARVTDAELECLAMAQVLLAMTTNGTGCAPRPAGWATCSRGYCATASTTTG